MKSVHARLITAGIDPNVRIWNVDAEKVVDKVNTGAYAVTHLALLQEWLFIGTSDKALFKYSMKTKTRTPVRIFDSAISCLKFTKKQGQAPAADDKTPVPDESLIVALTNGDILVVNPHISES